MAECNHDCSSCSSNCSERTEKQSFLAEANQFSKVKKVIGVVSGKGGVGKSLVSCLLAAKCQKEGLKCGVLDADITGPSVPKSFGVTKNAVQDETGLLPNVSKNGTKIMSINLLLEDENAPVVWRGPVISGVIQQFWKDVAWGDVDYMFVDMPPGTGDVPLTVFQSLPIDGVIIVTTPQDLVTMIVKKAFNMAQLMDVPVIGIIENMSYITCPDCGKKIEFFGKSNAEEISEQLGVPVLAKLPIEPVTASLVDKGAVELANTDTVAPVIDAIEKF